MYIAVLKHRRKENVSQRVYEYTSYTHSLQRVLTMTPVLSFFISFLKQKQTIMTCIHAGLLHPLSAHFCLPLSPAEFRRWLQCRNRSQLRTTAVSLCMHVCIGMYVRSDLPQETLIIPQIGKPHPPSPTSWAQNKDETNTMGTWGA